MLCFRFVVCVLFEFVLGMRTEFFWGGRFRGERFGFFGRFGEIRLVEKFRI